MSEATRCAFFGRLEKAADAGVLLYAGWTIVCQLVVLGRAGSYADLRVAAAIGLPVVLVASWWALRRRKGSFVVTTAASAADTVLTTSPRSRKGLFAVVVALVVAHGLTESFVPFWVGACALALWGWSRSVGAPSLDLSGPAVSPARRRALWALAAAAVLVTLCAHRANDDDGFFLNVAVHALQDPNDPLFEHDYMHDVPGLPMQLPVYKAHSWQPLFALLSEVTGLSPVAIAHLVLPPLAALATIFASALLLRVLLPGAWPWALAALFALQLAMGNTDSSFGNYAYVRLFHGKAVLASALLPYLVFATIRFMRTGRRADWLLLAAAHVAGVGLSATAVFVAPLAMGCALFACWRPDGPTTRRAALALASVAWIAAVALLLRPLMAEHIEIINGLSVANPDVPPDPRLYDGKSMTFDGSLGYVFGRNAYMALHLLGLLGAWALARDPARRRFLVGVAVPYLLLILNPWLYDLWVRHVTSGPVFWRLLWAAPLPIMIAFTLTEPFARGLAGEGRSTVEGHVPSWVPFALLVAFVALWVPRQYTLSQSNTCRLGVPDLKVKRPEYDIAREAAERAPPGTTVLGPRDVAAWVVTFPHHPRVVAFKRNALRAIAPHIGTEDFVRRFELLEYLMGRERPAAGPAHLADMIRRHRASVVVVETDNRFADEISATLTSAGFTREPRGPYDLWASEAPGHAPHER